MKATQSEIATHRAIANEGYITKMLIDLLHRINDKFDKTQIMQIVHKLRKQYDEAFFNNFVNAYSLILYENNECNLIHRSKEEGKEEGLTNEGQRPRLLEPDKDRNKPSVVRKSKTYKENLYRIDEIEDKEIAFNENDKRYGIDSFITNCYENINGLDGPDLYDLYLMNCEEKGIKEPTTKRMFIRSMKRFTGETVQKWVKIKISDDQEKRTVKRLYYLKPNIYAYFKYKPEDQKSEAESNVDTGCSFYEHDDKEEENKEDEQE